MEGTQLPKEITDAVGAGVIGIIGSLIASFVFLTFLTRLRPNLKISPVIARGSRLDRDKVFRIKVINRSKRDVIGVRAEMHLMETAGITGGPIHHSTPISLLRSELLHIAAFKRNDEDAQYAFRFVTEDDLDALWSKSSQYVRISIYATDSLSGFGRVFSRNFHNKKSEIEDGDFRFGDSFAVKA
jgi:hypothetical protein